jgi:hypothetical protein
LDLRSGGYGAIFRAVKNATELKAKIDGESQWLRKRNFQLKILASIVFTSSRLRAHMRGNCALHQEWIEKAARTTCSEMSNGRLQKGIYRLFGKVRGEWHYRRRETRIRTRLFLVEKGSSQRV